ncbi:MAG: D-threonine aldolase [Verrucomicrobiales bacterium]|nr:D-threonine aldolase [Verrucomicrobiales bacterium]
MNTLDSIASLDELPTPALVIDAVVARNNIRRLADYCAAHRIKLRPHTKTHKNRVIAKLQIEAGAKGLTVAKVGEAEQLQSETNDLLMAYPAVDRARCQRLAELAKAKTIRVVAESAIGIEALASAAKNSGSTIGVLVEIDVGMGRTGVATAQDALALAQLISKTKGLRLDGILCYPGHIWNSVAEQAAPLAAVSAKLQETIDLWKQNGLEAKIVSGGSTPTALRSHLVPQLTEIRSGTYVFNDMNTFRGGFCALADCSARIYCTVISTTVKDQIVLDGGTKTFTSDICIPARDSGNGYIVEYPDAKITALSEEHGQVNVSRCEKRPKVGERVSVIPNHICPCVNLQDAIWWREADGSLRKINVDARGKLS